MEYVLEVLNDKLKEQSKKLTQLNTLQSNKINTLEITVSELRSMLRDCQKGDDDECCCGECLLRAEMAKQAVEISRLKAVISSRSDE
tara:strand:+ start:459 stop:719 length:261 start_codon:yes stop_codon:yes gene_type:complete